MTPPMMPKSTAKVTGPMISLVFQGFIGSEVASERCQVAIKR